MHSKRRWLPAVALLLLLPLTMAPRTSWTIDSVMYDLAAAAPRDTVRPDSGVPLNLLLRSRSDDPLVAELVVQTSVDGAKDAVVLTGASQGCVIDGPAATCTVAVPPRGEQTVVIVARPLTKGLLVFDVDEGIGGEDFGTVSVEVSPASPPANGRPR